jgi:succinate dehydrogenase hydrophobic anchor subunit
MAVITTLFLYLVAVIAVVMMWRGLWGLLDEYVWPKNPRRSYWVTFIIGFLLIIAVFALI